MMESAKAWVHRCRKHCQTIIRKRTKDQSALSLITSLYLNHHDDDGLSEPLQVFRFLLDETKSEPEMALSLHQCIIRCGFESDTSLGSELIDFYINSHKLEEINKVFSVLDQSNIALWSMVISAHVTLGYSYMAIVLYTKMVQMSIEPNEHVLVSIFNACATSLDLNHGMTIHLHAIERGLDLNVYVGNSLIHMYLQCGKPDLAGRLFAKLPFRTVVTWNSLMSGQIRNELIGDAILLFIAMQHEKVIEPNDVSFSSVLKACAIATSIELGLKIHGYYIENGHKMNTHVGNSLINMYVKCGNLDDACIIFDMLSNRTVATWNTMIGGYSQHGHHHKVLELVDKMQEDKWKLNAITIVCAIKACSSMEAINTGEILHASIVENNYESNVFIGNGLIVLYANHARIIDALSIFHSLPQRSVSTWNSIIGAFALHGLSREAFLFFHRMQEDVQPNNATFVSVLKACSSSDVLQEGRQLHAIIIEYESTVEIDVGTCLLDMYAKCGSLHDACNIFDGLSKHNLITWNAMIMAYAQYGQCREAFYLFDKLQQHGLKPRAVTYIGMLKACCLEESESQGKIIHAHIVENDLALDISLGNILVEMYIKYGNLEDARKLIALMSIEQAKAWNALILAHTRTSGEIPSCDFEGILREGIGLDGRTLVSILSTCKHYGLVEQGCSHFKHIWENSMCSPMPEHYSCMGDLLGRAGCLNEASDILRTMPSSSSIVTSTSLLTHCKMHGNMDIGKHCFEHVNPL